MNIIEESQQRSSSPLIIDNFGTRYRITSPINFSFTAPSLHLLELNYYYLLKNSIRIKNNKFRNAHTAFNKQFKTKKLR